MDSTITERLIDMAQSGSNEGICMNCGADHLGHRACPECGWYRDRIAVQVHDNFEPEDEDEDVA